MLEDVIIYKNKLGYNLHVFTSWRWLLVISSIKSSFHDSNRLDKIWERASVISGGFSDGAQRVTRRPYPHHDKTNKHKQIFLLLLSHSTAHSSLTAQGRDCALHHLTSLHLQCTRVHYFSSAGEEMEDGKRPLGPRKSLAQHRRGVIRALSFFTNIFLALRWCILSPIDTDRSTAFHDKTALSCEYRDTWWLTNARGRTASTESRSTCKKPCFDRIYQQWTCLCRQTVGRAGKNYRANRRQTQLGTKWICCWYWLSESRNCRSPRQKDGECQTRMWRLMRNWLIDGGWRQQTGHPSRLWSVTSSSSLKCRNKKKNHTEEKKKQDQLLSDVEVTLTDMSLCLLVISSYHTSLACTETLRWWSTCVHATPCS